MSSEEAIKRLKEIKGDPTLLQPVMRYREPLEMAIAALTVEAEPVRHGRWYKIDISSDLSECSNCNERVGHPSNFCPYCGAKMDEKGLNNG